MDEPKFNTDVRLGSVSHEEAVLLLAFVNHYPKKFEYLREQLELELAPYYEYEIKCTDCPRKYTIKVKEPLTKAEIKKGGICVNCSDDYK